MWLGILAKSITATEIIFWLNQWSQIGKLSTDFKSQRLPPTAPHPHPNPCVNITNMNVSLKNETMMPVRKLTSFNHFLIKLISTSSFGPSCSSCVSTHCDLVTPYRDRDLGQILTQVMACCLEAPSHFLNQCGPLAFTWGHCDKNIWRYGSVKQDWKLHSDLLGTNELTVVKYIHSFISNLPIRTLLAETLPEYIHRRAYRYPELNVARRCWIHTCG